MKTATNTPSKLVRTVLAASLIALGGVAIGGNALALDSPTTSTTNGSISYPVGYSDLDLSTSKGANTLYLRIRFAAETVCESAATWGKKEGQACVKKAVSEAVASVGAPLLSQYLEQRSTVDRTGTVQLAKAN